MIRSCPQPESTPEMSDQVVCFTPKGWGIIGTYVDAKAAGRGIGKALFVSSLDAAREASVAEIDATISAGNEPGLTFYDAIGFETYQTKSGAVCKKYTLA